MSMRELTPFQIEMRKSASLILVKHELPVAFEEQGQHETFLHAKIPAPDLEIWIYEDEAELRFHGRQFLCEREAYSSQAELASDFLSELERVVTPTNLGIRGDGDN